MNGVQLDDSTSIPSAADAEVVYPTWADFPPVPKNHLGSSESSEYATFDEGTPDDWVKRDKRLVKLTGKVILFKALLILFFHFHFPAHLT